MEDPAIYRKTDKGKQEVAERAFGLESHLRRLLIMIDGQRDAAELSVYVRAGELESPVIPLAETLFNVGQFFTGNDTLYKTFKDQNGNVMSNGASTTPTWIKSAFTAPTGANKPLCIPCQLMGPVDGVELARRIGSELTRLAPRN